MMLTGGRSPICLALARMWKRKGWKVSIIEHKTLTFSRFSNCVSDYHAIPSPVSHFEQFSHQLLSLLERERPDVLIPVNEDILHYGRIQSEIRALAVSFDVVEQGLLERLHGKFSNIELAAQAGIPAPVTDYFDGEVVDWQAFILKPVYSRFGNQVITDQSGLRSRRQGDYVKQQKINGIQICTYGFARAGKLLAYACYQTNLGIENSVSLTFTPYRSRRVFEYMQRFIQTHQLTGSIGLDFLYDGDEYYFIECNPRLTHGAILLGEALPDVFMPGYAGESLLIMKRQRYGLKAAWLYKIVMQRKWWKTAKIYGKSRDLVADWSDPLPILSIPLILTWTLACAVIKRKPVLDFLTEDIIYAPDNGHIQPGPPCSIKQGPNCR
ncbi:ATP-grasp domain-containing protein [Budvicia diplopodorum]|uniref:ATP-grasp domain-containing protein n=1 Tax=Budvicia diplopodorum TaxID=1119056 RepID=UPI001FE420BF|nr:ATP-grasp domain-containing protein [Budvicia diplopodorum]